MILAIVVGGVLGAVQPQNEPQPLSGPTVSSHVTRTTLVSYDLNGRLRPVEGSADLAAVELLKLPPDAQASVDRVIAARAAGIDRFVTENLMLLAQLDSATKAGDKLDQAALLMDGFDKLRPALEGGPLRDRIIRALPAEAAARFRALRDEYWHALIDQAVRDNRAQGKHDARWAVALGEHIREIGEEITGSYERQTASGTLFIDYLLADVDLSPEQRQTVQSLKLDMLTRTGFKPSEEDQKRLGLGILAYLNAQQRARVLKKIPR